MDKKRRPLIVEGTGLEKKARELPIHFQHYLLEEHVHCVGWEW